MIESFGVLYQGSIVGNTDHGIGYGTPRPEDRWFDNDQVIGAYHHARELAEVCDDTGIDILWLAEHHFQSEGYEVISNLPMLALWLSQVTSTVRIGCGFNVLPTWNALRLAEDYALADILSDGRVIFGVARGYHEREIATMTPVLASLDDASRRRYFEEQVDVLLTAFHEDRWRHEGEFFQLPPDGITYRGKPLTHLTLVPRPKRIPVEVWQPTTSSSPRGLEFMANRGLKGMVSGMTVEKAVEVATAFRDAHAALGRDIELGEDFAIGMRAYLAPTRDEAIKQSRVYYEEYGKFAAPLDLFPYADEIVADLGLTEQSIRTVSFDEYIESGAWFAGTPNDFVELIEGVQDRLPGLKHFLLALHIPANFETNIAQVRLFGSEVTSAIRERGAH